MPEKNAVIRMMEYLDKSDKRKIIITSYFFIMVLGAVDYITGHRILFMPFYALPIAVIAWFGKKHMRSAEVFLRLRCGWLLIWRIFRSTEILWFLIGMRLRRFSFILS